MAAFNEKILLSETLSEDRVWYVEAISDGDSKTILILNENKPCGGEVAEQECSEPIGQEDESSDGGKRSLEIHKCYSATQISK